MKSSSKPRPTLRDVARLAGVSHMTVSRALSGGKLVAPATLTAVQGAVRKIGYRPDPSLSALAAYRTGSGSRGRGSVMAFLDCDGNAFSAVVLEGARAEAGLLGYSITRFEIPPGSGPRPDLSRMLFHRGIRGLLFGPSNDARQFAGWEWEHFAPVSLGAIGHAPVMHSVCQDYFQTGFQGAQHLAGMGCRRIGFAVNEAQESRTGHRWIGGFSAALTGPRRPILFRGNTTSRAALREWAKSERLDGVLTIHHAVWRALQGMPIRVLKLNSIEAAPGAAHFHLDPGAVGREGVRLLHHLLLRHELGLPEQPKMVALQSELRPAVADAR